MKTLTTPIEQSRDLMPMAEYVLWIRSLRHSELRTVYPNRISEIVFKGNVKESAHDFVTRDAQLYQLICERAKSLFEKITLGDLVPTDREGNVYADHEAVKDSLTTGLQKLEYQAAKDRVKIEGFEVGDIKEDVAVLVNEDLMLYLFIYERRSYISGAVSRTVETFNDLTGLGLKLKS